jgi:hypothetical protein
MGSEALRIAMREEREEETGEALRERRDEEDRPRCLIV